MKHLKTIVIIFIFGAFYILYAFYIRQGHINKIYQHTEHSEIWDKNCKSTVILVDDAPLSHYALEKLWKKNSKEIIEKWNPFTDECDDVLFVKNNIGYIKHSGDVKFWIADDEICLNDSLGGCISWEDRLFYVGLRASILGNETVGEINGKPIYIRFIGQ
ncbi:MAG: hypothetical protein RR686_17855 [Morganella sp. (in: enterobacteria)]